MIGLNGLKGSGKDTVGAYLVEQYGFVRYSFADMLKESAAALFGIEPALWDELKNEETTKVILKRGNKNLDAQTARSFLQRYGTEAHRDIFGEDFWVDAVMEKIDEAYGGYRVIRGQRVPQRDFGIVFTDARFPNELKAIRSVGGKNIRIIRPGSDAGDTHASEAEAPDDLIDAVLWNDGTLGELADTVDAIMDELA